MARVFDLYTEAKGESSRQNFYHNLVEKKSWKKKKNLGMTWISAGGLSDLRGIFRDGERKKLKEKN